jgi:hypothetical protein
MLNVPAEGYFFGFNSLGPNQSEAVRKPFELEGNLAEAGLTTVLGCWQDKERIHLFAFGAGTSAISSARNSAKRSSTARTALFTAAW